MLKNLLLAVTLLLSSTLPAGSDAGEGRVILATTTSVVDTGLLERLVAEFERSSSTRVRTVPVGSGQALSLGRRGEADLLLVHSPQDEEEFIRKGFGVRRTLVMTNEFLVVGPPDDPAGIRGKSPVEAFRSIAARGALFVSRGDASGTDRMEKSLWRLAGVDPAGRRWYQESGTGMGQTLVVASEKRAYTLTDRSTFTVMSRRLRLTPLSSSPTLVNPYHLIVVNPSLSPRIDARGAEKLSRFFLSPRGQEIIATYGTDRWGFPLFRAASPPRR